MAADPSLLMSLVKDKKDEQRRKQAALIQSIPALYQLGTAVVQRKRAKKIEKQAGERPEYVIAPAYQKAMEQAQMLASQRELPGQSLMENKIAGATASGVEQLKGASTNQADIMAGLANMYVNQMGQQSNLDISAAQNFMNNQANLSNAYSSYGALQTEQRQRNVIDPWNEAMATASALREGAIRNSAQSIQGLSNAWSNAIAGNQGYSQDTAMKMAMGQNQGGASMSSPLLTSQPASGFNYIQPKPSSVNTQGIGSVLMGGIR